MVNLETKGYGDHVMLRDLPLDIFSGLEKINKWTHIIPTSGILIKKDGNVCVMLVLVEKRSGLHTIIYETSDCKTRHEWAIQHEI